MKRVCISAVALLMLVATAWAAAFEGKVVYDVDSGGREIDMTVYVKDQKSRVELGMPGRSINLLMDWAEQKAFMLMDQQQMAMAVPLALPQNLRNKVEDDDAVEPERTGKTRTILGYECEQWIVRNDDHTVEIWSARGLGNFTGFLGQAPLGINTGFPDISAITQLREFFPMVVTVKNRGGRQVFSMQAREVEQQQLAAGLFTVPASYRIVDAPEGMGSVQNRSKGK